MIKNVVNKIFIGKKIVARKNFISINIYILMYK